MNKELELWQFIAERLTRGENVMLLVVAESAGSSPGRRGYKMAVGVDGELSGSIGGGVMEVNLVEESRRFLRDTERLGRGEPAVSSLSEQVHQKNSPHASGMICSGKQTVIFKLVTPVDAKTVDSAIDAVTDLRRESLTITPTSFFVGTPHLSDNPKSKIQNPKSNDFTYTEQLGFEYALFIIGGGHCALALSELMSKMNFHITLFDDRPELNTIAKNEYAHEIKIVDSYERIGDHISSGLSAFVVVMTLGYKTDEVVIRSLVDREFKYFGVLGSKAKMSTMLRELRESGISPEKLDSIHTPVGLPIHSRTPEEIAVSIAAEIISVKNGPV